MTVVSQVILKADDELRYPSVGELKNINDFLKTGEQRVRIASTLADNEKKIVDRASTQLWKKRPDFIAPGGNASGSRETGPMSSGLWLVSTVDYLWSSFG